MKAKRRFSYAEHREEEAFLERHHREGLCLASKKGDVYTFQEVAPIDVEYRIEVAEPGTDIASWKAYREHLGFTLLFVENGQHYMFRENNTGERLEKKDRAFREAHVQSAAIRRVLRAFFFVILAVAVYMAPVPSEMLWLKLALAALSVFGIVFFSLQAIAEMQLLKALQDK